MAKLSMSAKRFLAAVLILSGAESLAEQRCDTSEYPLSAPTERFSDNGDGTVTDSASGLMWMRCALGQTWDGKTCSGDPETYAWPETPSAAEQINTSGEHFFSDWRVPGLRDLAMIAERECQDPRINLTVFPNTASAFYWTSTPRAGDNSGGEAYALSFGDEGVQPRPTQSAHYLRLVRSAQ